MNSSILRLAASNETTPPQHLEELAQKSLELARIVAANLASKRQTSIELRIAATKTIAQNYPEITGNILAQLVESREPSVAKMYLLLHPIAPSEFLAQHFRSSFWLERYAVAQNPNTSSNIRQYLIQDGNTNSQ